jgi:transcriptional regulator with XRE-family HTH domain
MVKFLDRCKDFFDHACMVLSMNKADSDSSHLRELRLRSGLPLREAARRLDVLHTKLVYWEKTGKVPHPDLVMKLATLYGVSVEEVLGQPKLRNVPPSSGRMGRVLEAASRLPRRQQQKIIDMAEAYIAQYEQGHAKEEAVGAH